MIHDRIDSLTTRWMRSRSEALDQAFRWIEALPPEPEPGTVELRGADLSIILVRYDTLPEIECRWESHREMIDVHLCLAGSENIDWAPEGALDPDGDYDPAIEAQFWKSRVGTGIRLPMHTGNYALFLPGELHRPKVADGIPCGIYKLVVKIRRSLLGI